MLQKISFNLASKFYLTLRQYNNPSMEIEDFTVPYNLEALVKEDAANPEGVKRELKKFTRSKCLQILTDADSYDFIAWAIDHSKGSDQHVISIAEILEELCSETADKVKHFFKHHDSGLEDIGAIQSFKKAACLMLLYLKTTLKGSKSNIMQTEDSKKLKNRLVDPLLQKQLSLLTFLSKTIDSYGGKSEMLDPELGIHLLDVAFRFIKCGLINEGAAIEHLTKLIRNLMLYHFCKNHEFNAKLLNSLEDGAEEGGKFTGKLMASLLVNGKENLAEIAHESIMRIIEILMTRKYSDSPLYKNSREFLLEIVENEPLYFYNNFGIFVILLGCENYTIRTFVCEAMLRSSVFLRERAMVDTAIKEKILKFFEIVCERTKDKSSFARSSVLGCISSYINLGLLNDEAFNEVFIIACERITDNSSMVRKKALVLLQELCIVFKARLPTQEQLAEEIFRITGNTIDQEKSKKDREALNDESQEVNENTNGQVGSKSKSKHSKILEELDRDNERVEYNEDDLLINSKSKRKGKKKGNNGPESSALKNMGILEETIDPKRREELRPFYEGEESNSLTVDLPAVDQQLLKLRFYEKIYQYLHNVLPDIKVLIFSRSTTDTIESLRLIYIFTQMELKSSRPLFFESFKLIWIKEQQIKDELLRIFHRVFINKYSAEQVIENLISVFNECDLNARVSLEEIVNQLLKRDCDERDGKANHGIDKLQISIKKNLWDIFLQIYTESAQREKCIKVLKLLKLCTNLYPQWIPDNITSIFEVIKDMMTTGFSDFEILAEFSGILTGLVSENTELKDVIVKSLMYFLLKYQGTFDPYYPHFMEKVVYVIFSFKKNPEVVCDYLVKRLTTFLTKDSLKNYSQPLFDNPDHYFHVPLSQIANNSQGEEADSCVQRSKLVHLILAVGHIALKFLFYFEKIDAILQSRRSKIQNTQVQNELEQAIGGADAEYEAQREVLSALINKRIFKDSLLSSFLPLFVHIIRTELEMASNGQNAEAPSLKGSKGNLISQPNMIPRSSNQSHNQFQSQPDMLNRSPVTSSQRQGSNSGINLLALSALDSLCKYMMVSSVLCTEHLSLIFEVIDNPHIHSGFASNAIIYLGDLFHKHPNILSPYMNRIFNCLKSKSSAIRRTAVTVLSHLILNDFVKLKAEVADFVFLLDDEDPQIIEIANLFFHQLSEKDNKFIYNILPDAISRLSLPEEQHGVSEIHFEKFAKFFLKFIQKEKVVENLIEKLILRLKGKENDKEIRNIVYCIFCLVNNDKGLQKLNENVETLRLVIDVHDVRQVMKNLFYRLRKNTKINKVSLDELEGILFQNTEDIFNELKKRKQDKQRPKRGRKANG
jgi:hypothetical protein